MPAQGKKRGYKRPSSDVHGEGRAPVDAGGVETPGARRVPRGEEAGNGLDLPDYAPPRPTVAGHVRSQVVHAALLDDMPVSHLESEAMRVQVELHRPPRLPVHVHHLGIPIHRARDHAGGTAGARERERVMDPDVLRWNG